MADSFTDRDSLATDAYPDSANLKARRAIYDYRVPPLDFGDWALDQIAIAPSNTVLDVGCGHGLYLQRLPADVNAIGFDISAGMLGEALRARPDAHVAVADAQAVPLPDATVDVALAMHMLYHVPDVDRAVSELRRVLKPDGILLASTNSLAHLQELDALLLRAAGTPSDDGVHANVMGRFDLDGGRAVLGRHFMSVEQREAIGEIVVDDPAPIVAYVESARSLAAPFLPSGLSFDSIIAGVRRLATDVIERDGVFRGTAHAGVFICRGLV